jgi:hypothetical protein
MGRFDALTQIEEPKKPTPQRIVTSPSTAKHPTKPAPPPQEAKKPTNPQNRLPTTQSPTLGLTEKPEKYTTHIFPSLVKKVRLHAVEQDINDYDVVNNALILYFDKNK